MSINEDEFIESHIKYIRNMSMLDDVNIRALLKIKVAEDPSILEKYVDNKMKRQYDEISKIAKNIKTEPTKFARRINDGISKIAKNIKTEPTKFARRIDDGISLK